MTKYTPPTKRGEKNVKRKSEDEEEEQEQEQTEDEEDDDKQGKERRVKSKSLDSSVLEYLVRKGFVNDIKVTMTFDELVECIESVSE